MQLATDHFDNRRRAHDLLAPRLAALSDDHLAALLAQAPSWRDHVLGNQSGTLVVEGVKIFIKKIALTDLEREPGNEGSTANLFGLPHFYQYGVGSAGFGAWRELQAYLKTSAWALSGECPYFPLVHHWRVMPRTVRAPPSAEQQAWLDQAPAFWNGSDAVRARLEAISAATSTIVLFLEYVPEMLHSWLKNRFSGQQVGAALEGQILTFDDQMRAAAAFMNDHGMLHFDLHTKNTLTDGRQVYVTDFGLVLSGDFDLSPSERTFFEAHRFYDRAYLDWVLVEKLAPRTAILTPALAARAGRSAPVAKIFGDFFKVVAEESRLAPYPAEALEAAFTPEMLGVNARFDV
jgi:serine/threonine protein kinase